MSEISADTRWRVAVSMMNGSFEFYLQSQAAMGYSREEALARLKRSWPLEDREKLAGIAEIGRLSAHAG